MTPPFYVKRLIDERSKAYKEAHSYDEMALKIQT
jgi:hypothetical protein